MSDTAKRDAVLAGYRIDRSATATIGVTRILAGHDGQAMADRIVALEDKVTTLEAAVERVLALHEIFGTWCDRCNCVAPCATLRALEGTP